MTELFVNNATASLMAKNWTKKSSHLFEELKGSNSEFKLYTPKPNTGTYFDTILSMFDSTPSVTKKGVH